MHMFLIVHARQNTTNIVDGHGLGNKVQREHEVKGAYIYGSLIVK